MPTHNTIITLPSGPSNPRSRRRLPPSPAKPAPKPEDAPIPSVTRHYPIPAIHPSSSQTPTIGTHTSPFPPSLPSLRSDTAIETTHFSQDDLTEEVWGPRVTLEPLEKKNKKHKHKGRKKEKEGDMKQYLKMCPTNGYQPRKEEGDGEEGMVTCEVSGSTEFVTSYQVERLVGGGRRRTWVTWSRVVVRREEGAEGGGEEESEEDSGESGGESEEEGGSSEESEKTEEEEEEKGKGAKKGKIVKKEKMGKKGKEIEESSDEEYFDGKRCEWWPKEELKRKKSKEVVEEGKKRGKK